MPVRPARQLRRRPGRPGRPSTAERVENVLQRRVDDLSAAEKRLPGGGRVGDLIVIGVGARNTAAQPGRLVDEPARPGYGAGCRACRPAGRRARRRCRRGGYQPGKLFQQVGTPGRTGPHRHDLIPVLPAGRQDQVGGVDVRQAEPATGEAITRGPEPGQGPGGIRVQRAAIKARRAGTGHPERRGLAAEPYLQPLPGNPLGHHRPADISGAHEENPEVVGPAAGPRCPGQHRPLRRRGRRCGRRGRHPHRGRCRHVGQRGAEGVTVPGWLAAKAAIESCMIAVHS